METIMNFMAKDHDRLDSLFSQFRNFRNNDADKALELFNEFKTGLERHIVWEEEILFPFFEEKTGMYGGPTEVMRNEHLQIKDFLAQIHNEITTGVSEKIIALENELLEILTNHNQKEEGILYPWIDNSASETDIKELLLKIEKMS
jgi:iron-sulfur cluster repair protein YtfE (RIC family)